MSDPATTRCYGLVTSHEEVWQVYEACQTGGVDARIAPTPRTADAHASCGTSLLIDCGDRERLAQAAASAGVTLVGIIAVANAIDPHRDRYC